MALMKYIIAILKEVKIMNNITKRSSGFFELMLEKMNNMIISSGERDKRKEENRVLHPFVVILNKEISDHVRSWRFIILIIIISLTCLGSMYTALAGFGNAVKSNSTDGAFFFLKLFTVSDGTLPSFVVFISFLGPLLGISLGFDAVNSEQNKGTLSRILSQPIHRDYLLNAKFLAALIVISIMFFALGFLVMGFGLITIGIPPTAEEFMRIIFFIVLSIVYVAFWLNLSILFSVQFRQPSTSALAGIAVWLFFSVFYAMIVNLVMKASAPGEMATTNQLMSHESLKLGLLRIMPNQLFSEATTTLLMPSVRSLGPLTMEQVYGTIPGPLPLGQSLLLVWPQLTGLIAATIVCFLLSYISFMRREIRSR
jgi:ABC-2 type transport system permease protein